MLFGFKIIKADAVAYKIVARNGYYVVQRTYKNGNVKTDRLGSVRGNSTLRTATNGRTF